MKCYIAEFINKEACTVLNIQGNELIPQNNHHVIQYCSPNTFQIFYCFYDDYKEEKEEEKNTYEAKSFVAIFDTGERYVYPRY